MRDKKGVVSDWKGDGEELGGAEGGETIIKIHCIRKEYSFNKRKIIFVYVDHELFVHVSSTCRN